MIYQSRGNVQTLGLCISLNSLKVDITVRVESSENGYACVQGLQPSSLIVDDTGRPGSAFGIVICCVFLLLFICQVEVLEGFQEQAGDSRQLNTAMCLSMKTAFLGFLPAMVGCQEKMFLAL